MGVSHIERYAKRVLCILWPARCRTHSSLHITDAQQVTILLVDLPAEVPRLDCGLCAWLRPLYAPDRPTRIFAATPRPIGSTTHFVMLLIARRSAIGAESPCRVHHAVLANRDRIARMNAHAEAGGRGTGGWAREGVWRGGRKGSGHRSGRRWGWWLGWAPAAIAQQRGQSTHRQKHQYPDVVGLGRNAPLWQLSLHLATHPIIHASPSRFPRRRPGARDSRACRPLAHRQIQPWQRRSHRPCTEDYTCRC